MTTWTNGDTITSTWMNSVEKVLALGTFGATTSPRLTITPSSTFDLATNTTATNLTFSGTATVATGKQFEAIGFRTLTSAVSGTGLSTAINVLHTTTLTDANSFAYLFIGSVTASSGAGKAAGIYARCVHGGAGFTGTLNAGELAISSVAGASHNANSSLLAMYHDTTDTSVAFPLGVALTSNTAGAKVNNPFVVLSTVDVTQSVLQWNMRAGSTGSFLTQYNSSNFILFAINYLGNLAWGTTDHLISMDGTTVMGFKNNTDITIGKAGAAAADTTGHVYVQAVAGAPTGVPTGYAGYVPMRYDSTNNKIYVYNGAWKATAALT